MPFSKRVKPELSNAYTKIATTALDLLLTSAKNAKLTQFLAIYEP